MYKALKKAAREKSGIKLKTGEAAPESKYEPAAGTDFTDMSISYRAENRAPVVQMVRKRVKGSAGVFDAGDIYYDKADGRYYNGMTREGHGEVTVSRAEHAEYLRLSAGKERTAKTAILARAQQGGEIKYAGGIRERAEAAGEEAAGAEAAGADIVAGEGAAEADIVAEADIYTEGAVLSPPKTVRLYAEGNMKHAASIARAFRFPGKYSLFENLDEETKQEDADEETPEALVKATEFDTLERLGDRYAHGRNDRSRDLAKTSIMERVGAPENLEASFGGSTGDMARPVADEDLPAERHTRQYDIIQTTFFWIPEATNEQNFIMLRTFMLNQSGKLTPGGKIRIVLSNKDTHVRGMEDHNHYREVADRLTGDPELNANLVINLKLFKGRDAGGHEIPQTYAEKLEALGMNEEDFVHTRTAKDETVQSRQDLLLEAVRRH